MNYSSFTYIDTQEEINLNKFLQWIKKNIAGIIIVILFFGIPMIQNAQKSTSAETKSVQYTEFMQMVKDKKVDKVSIDLTSSTFKFADTDGANFTTDNPKDKDFKKTLLENGVKVSEYESSNMLDIVSKLINFAFLLLMGFGDAT